MRTAAIPRLLPKRSCDGLSALHFIQGGRSDQEAQLPTKPHMEERPVIIFRATKGLLGLFQPSPMGSGGNNKRGHFSQGGRDPSLNVATTGWPT